MAELKVSIEYVIVDDCLEHIFRFLTVKELIGVERVCKRWGEIARSCCSVKKYLDCNDFIPKEVHPSLFRCHLKTSHVKQVLSRCGNTLHYLHFPLDKAKIDLAEALKLIGDYCVNLQYLSIVLFWENFEIPESFLDLLSKLKALKLQGSVYFGIISQFLIAAKNLEKLVLFRVHKRCGWDPLTDLTGNCRHLEFFKCDITMLDDLERFMPQLEVFKADNITYRSLMSLNTKCRVLILTGPFQSNALSKNRLFFRLNEVIQRLTNLEIFELGCHDWPLLPLALAPSANTLKELHLPNGVFLNPNLGVPFFPNLRILKTIRDFEYCLWMTKRTGMDIVDTLAGRCPNLEELDMTESCHGLNVLSRLGRLGKLKRLVLNFCRFSMNDECLRFISENMSAKLECFECRGVPFSDDELLRLVRQCENLFQLKADLQDRDKFIEEACKIVETRRKRIILHLYLKEPYAGTTKTYTRINVEKEYRSDAGELLIQALCERCLLRK